MTSVPEPVVGRTDGLVPEPVEGRRAAVVVASNRASAGVYEDQTGPLLVEALRRDKRYLRDVY